MKEIRDELAPGVILVTLRPILIPWFCGYETIISFDSEKSWYILGRYNSEEDAVSGHRYFRKISLDDLMQVIN